jgi:hypothetical protein
VGTDAAGFKGKHLNECNRHVTKDVESLWCKNRTLNKNKKIRIKFTIIISISLETIMGIYLIVNYAFFYLNPHIENHHRRHA